MRDGQLYILRCACRDWPCHLDEALSGGPPCGLCGQPAEFVMEPYQPNPKETPDRCAPSR